MNKWHKLKLICSCAITLALLFISLYFLTGLMERKAAVSKFYPFFEQQEPFDVFFLGSSHMIYSVYPMELWKNYGIVSYNLGGHGEPLPTTYWVMENALEHTTPQLVVIDCVYLNVEYKTNDKFSNIHATFDALPLNRAKLAAAYDLLDDPAMEQMIQAGTARELRPRTHMELLWDFSIYHTRWAELDRNDLEVSYTKTKGADYMRTVSLPDDTNKIARSQKLEGETTGVRYLKKMIEDCQNRGIDVLLVFIPFPAEESRQMIANRVYDIAEEYGVNYINFLDMNVVDYDTDCADSNSHLNASGALKITQYLGQYITEQYKLADHRNDPLYASWHNDYAEWTQELADILRDTTDLERYLMLLTDPRYTAAIEINNPAVWENEIYARFLTKLGLDEEHYAPSPTSGTDSSAEDRPDVHITVWETETNELVDCADFML